MIVRVEPRSSLREKPLVQPDWCGKPVYLALILPSFPLSNPGSPSSLASIAFTIFFPLMEVHKSVEMVVSDLRSRTGNDVSQSAPEWPHGRSKELSRGESTSKSGQLDVCAIGPVSTGLSKVTNPYSAISNRSP